MFCHCQVLAIDKNSVVGIWVMDCRQHRVARLAVGGTIGCGFLTMVANSQAITHTRIMMAMPTPIGGELAALTVESDFPQHVKAYLLK